MNTPIKTWKLISLLLLASVCLAGCQKQVADYPAKAAAMFDAFNKHDWKRMAGYYAQDAEFLDPSLGKDFVKQTPDEIVAKYTGMQQMFPDIHDEIKSVHSAGESVIIEFVSTGTTQGIKFTLPIVTILTFKDGLIVRDATYYDLENI